MVIEFVFEIGQLCLDFLFENIQTTFIMPLHCITLGVFFVCLFFWQLFLDLGLASSNHALFIIYYMYLSVSVSVIAWTIAGPAV